MEGQMPKQPHRPDVPPDAPVVGDAAESAAQDAAIRTGRVPSPAQQRVDAGESMHRAGPHASGERALMPPTVTSGGSEAGAAAVPRFDDRLTGQESAALSAYRRCRAARPGVYPTVAEVAHELGRSTTATSDLLMALRDKGWLARIRGLSKRAGRVYMLTVEAAARPHLVELLQLARRVADVPEDAVAEPHRAEWAAARVTARAVCAQVVLDLRALREHDAARFAAEMQSSA
jgi:DNA-binding MarR family transcriptional regulator